MNILVTGIPSNPFEHKYRIHYSIFKSLGIATGFEELGHTVYMMSRHESIERDGIIFKPHSEMDLDFIKSIDLVIFGLELGVEKSINASSGLTEAVRLKLNGESGLPLFVVKMGKHAWLGKSRWGYKDGYRLFDYFFSQEPQFAEDFKKEVGDPDKKIFSSKMGVFNSTPGKSGTAPFKLRKYNLFYMGRLRQSPSRMPFIKDMMTNLGPDFHLNLLPGSFSKPKGFTDTGSNRNKFGSETSENYAWLVNHFKVPHKNITIHHPVEWGLHWDYLKYSHLGLDFSPNHSNKKYIAGNAKLLEYMAAGLPSITEPGAGNYELVTEANGGIVIQQSGNLNQYCTAIKKALSMTFDTDEIARITVKNNSWRVRAEEMMICMGLSTV